MKVIASVPRFWYLLQDADALILTVSCEYSFVGYDFTMKLDANESSNFLRAGSACISELAEAINYSCPIAIGGASVFKTRNIDAEYSDAIGRAVGQWQTTS